MIVVKIVCILFLGWLILALLMPFLIWLLAGLTELWDQMRNFFH